MSVWAKKSAVVVKQGADLTEENSTEWCRTQFVANKYPRHVEFSGRIADYGHQILKRYCEG